MKVLFYVFNNPKYLDSVLSGLVKLNIKGGTVFDCSGMGREMARVHDHDEFTSMFGGLRSLFGPDYKNTKALMLILTEDHIPEVIGVIENVVGNLESPETGILFTFNLDMTKGIKL